MNTDITTYYHVGSRCVRRAYLCGNDQQTQKNYDHRRKWIEDRIMMLSSVFAVNICAYSVMSNHYHIVLKLEPHQVKKWNDEEILRRWMCLYKGPPLIHKYSAGKKLSPPEIFLVQSLITKYRKRLADLSWFMKCLNEPIARQANKEDCCTGHFWESRFSSKGLNSYAALITCMVYVDLNPIRAKLSDRPENSEYTSVKSRLDTKQSSTYRFSDLKLKTHLQKFRISIKPLQCFSDGTDWKLANALPLSFYDYIELLDWTGKCVRRDKTGSIPIGLDPILVRLGLTTTLWIRNTTEISRLYRNQKSTSSFID